jgi:hypothetical protein
MFLTPSPIADIWILAIIGLMFLESLRQMRQKRWMILDPLNMFWGGVLVCYVLQPIAYYESLTGWWGRDVLVKAIFWCFFGLVFVVIGYESKLGVRWGYKLPAMPRDLRPRAFYGLGLFFVALGFLGYAYLISTTPGLWAWLSVGRGGTNWGDTSGYLAALQTALPVGVTILLFHAGFHQISQIRRIVIWCAGGLMWLWFVYLGSRGQTIVFAVIVLAAYFLPRRRNPSLLFLAPLMAFLFLLTSFQAYYRGQFVGLSFNLGQLNWEEVQQRVLPKVFGGGKGVDYTRSQGDLEMNCVMAVVSLVPGRVGYNYGSTLLELVTHPIPRALWPAKRYPLYEAQTDLMREGQLSSHWVDSPDSPEGGFLTGPALTYIGYWYHAGGGVALAIAGVLTGAFLRMIRTIYDREPSNQGNVLLYATLLQIGFVEAAATPLYWLFSLPVMVIPLIILLRYCRTREAPEMAPIVV